MFTFEIDWKRQKCCTLCGQVFCSGILLEALSFCMFVQILQGVCLFLSIVCFEQICVAKLNMIMLCVSFVYF